MLPAAPSCASVFFRCLTTPCAFLSPPLRSSLTMSFFRNATRAFHAAKQTAAPKAAGEQHTHRDAIGAPRFRMQSLFPPWWPPLTSSVLCACACVCRVSLQAPRRSARPGCRTRPLTRSLRSWAVHAHWSRSRCRDSRSDTRTSCQGHTHNTARREFEGWKSGCHGLRGQLRAPLVSGDV